MAAGADDPTDAELVALIRSGDRAAGAALLARHEGLVRLAVRRLGRLPPRVDRDDLLQSGRLALHKAAVTEPPDGWDPGGRAKFSTYAYQGVWWSVCRCLRAYQDRAAGANLGDSADLVPATRSPGRPPSAPDPDVMAGLCRADREILSLVYGVGREAVSIHEAARLLGLSYTGARGRLVRALDRVRVRLHAARPARGVAE